jgi:hypothetical protein
LGVHHLPDPLLMLMLHARLPRGMICRCSREQRWPESVLPFRLGDGDSLGSTPLLVEATWTSLDHYEHSSLKHAPAEAFHRLSAPINSKSPSVSMISDRNEGRREERRRSTVEPKWEWWGWWRSEYRSRAQLPTTASAHGLSSPGELLRATPHYPRSGVTGA